jgi:hypothetical protein
MAVAMCWSEQSRARDLALIGWQTRAYKTTWAVEHDGKAEARFTMAIYLLHPFLFHVLFIPYPVYLAIALTSASVVTSRCLYEILLD